MYDISAGAAEVYEMVHIYDVLWYVPMISYGTYLW